MKLTQLTIRGNLRVGTSVSSSAPSADPVPSPISASFAVGVNIHEGGTDTAQASIISSIMDSRNFIVARMDLYQTGDSADIRTQAQLIRNAGGRVQGILLTPQQDDHTVYTNAASLSAHESSAYSYAAILVNQYKDLITDFELLNEVTHRSECSAQLATNSGQLESAYTGKTAFVSIARAMKGMAQAVRDNAPTARIIVGTTGRDWGFPRFLTTQGVSWDVLGYHYYPRFTDATLATDTWFGTGGLFTNLGSFGKQVTWNEFNSGEIYDAYVNVEGDALFEQGMQSVSRHLQALRAQTTFSLDSVCIYELLDEPAKVAPENRFGLMFTTISPKPQLYLATAFAGGALTTAERSAITSRNLLTNAQIDAMQPASAPAPAPAPAPPTESAHGSEIPPFTQLIDSALATWTVSGGVVLRDGAQTPSSSVTLLLYYNAVIYQQNSFGAWWLWQGGSQGQWVGAVDPRASSSGSAPSPMPTITVERHPVDRLQVGNQTTRTYHVEDNRWGAATITEGANASEQFQQAVGRALTVGVLGEVAWRTTFYWPQFVAGVDVEGGGFPEVKGFPAIIYGRKPGSYGSDIWPAFSYAVRMPDGAVVYPPPAGTPANIADNALWQPAGGSISTLAPSGHTPGTHLPAQLPLSAGTFTTAGRFSISATGKLHVAFDIWLQQESPQTHGFTNASITHEIMIPMRNFGNYGAHGTRNPGWYDHDVTIDGVLYHVYCAKNLTTDPVSGSQSSGTVVGLQYNFGGLNPNYTNEETGSGRVGWKFIVFQHDGSAHPLLADGTFRIDIQKFMAHLATRTDSRGVAFIRNTEYLVSTELGIEQVYGRGDFTCWDYRARI